jgi:plasmid stabilization system protein ParE
VAQVVYSSESLADLERIIEFLLQAAPDASAAALAQIRSAITILEAHPRIGRRVDAFRRELVITHGASGYLALYRHDAKPDIVRILRIRHQREAGYRD